MNEVELTYSIRRLTQEVVNLCYAVNKKYNQEKEIATILEENKILLEEVLKELKRKRI